MEKIIFIFVAIVAVIGIVGILAFLLPGALWQGVSLVVITLVAVFATVMAIKIK